MNINNFESPGEYPVDLLGDIFKRQRDLAEKYHPIEKANGFWVGDTIEVSLHDKMGQARIKDFSWRVTEELMEAFEAYEMEDEAHCKEEVADALHFMIELCLICSVAPEELRFDVLEDADPDRYLFGEDCFHVTYHLGLACNCLKNKPWKQTQMLTDIPKFRSEIKKAFSCLMEAARKAGIEDCEDMYDLYFRKNKVNQFRQESKY